MPNLMVKSLGAPQILKIGMAPPQGIHPASDLLNTLRLYAWKSSLFGFPAISAGPAPCPGSDPAGRRQGAVGHAG